MRDVGFCGIGAMKAGTSWIHACLYEHPEIFLPAHKEIHFFSQYFNKGLDWYASQFQSPEDAKIVGEFSPSYLYSPEAPRRISEYDRNIRLIVCLRDPVERTQSAFRYAIQTGALPPSATFEKAIDRMRGLVEHSLYYPQIQRYLQCFAKEQLHILLYEDMKSDPVAAIQDIYRFLGVEASYCPTMAHKKVNESRGVPRSRCVAQLMKQSADLLRMAGQDDFVWRMGRSPMVEGLRRLNTRPPVRTQLSRQTEMDLHARLAADIPSLSDILQRDLHSIWRKTALLGSES